ncbi:DNA-binding response regulator, LytR/AlgR family [Pseudarcicella hirudinis]|uniref:DNA-binding response regulator, LytR/AlgR family n=1 Tax=Pseudarcicella hirudinis TaxID=1079859 RepID=A0A1I5TMR3_9BACT|nr:LytTR family DNA-binding domain-containing protein [Pseudarcicella hirudinis]SFP83907.1 DNA-binding response regulator, LytR/AlgR family [Pseudarcicella hirudinis]
MGKKLQCIFVEDEAPARDLLRSYAERTPTLEVLDIFENAHAAADFLALNDVDLIFTDVTMPRFSGLDMIRTLRKKPFIVIITANPEYAVDGYDLEIVDFLLKPVSFDRFVRSVNKVFTSLENTSSSKKEEDPEDEDEYSVSSIYVKESGKVIRVDYDEIVAVEGLKDYVKIITSDRAVVTYITMKKLEENILPKNKFIRIHKSFIVKIDQIRSVDAGNSSIELRNKSELPIGPQYKENLLNRLKPIN